MKLNKAIAFFENATSETTSKAEIKVYNQFLQLLNGLKSRDFTEEEMLSIEIELNLLKLDSNPKNRKRFFKKALNAFETYLNDTYSLIVKGYYSGLGITLGSTFGLLFGMIVFHAFERNMGMLVGSIGGLVLGAIIGRSMDAKALAEGRAL